MKLTKDMNFPASEKELADFAEKCDRIYEMVKIVIESENAGSEQHKLHVIKKFLEIPEIWEAIK